MRDVVPPRKPVPGEPPAWVDLIEVIEVTQPSTPALDAQDAARLAADVDTDDLDDADWFAVAPMLSRWPREQS